MIYIVADPHQPLLGVLTPLTELRIDLSSPDIMGNAAIVVPPNTRIPVVERLRRRFPAAEVWECRGALGLRPGDQVYDMATAEIFFVEAP